MKLQNATLPGFRKFYHNASIEFQSDPKGITGYHWLKLKQDYVQLNLCSRTVYTLKDE
jgi:hypothetical protein